MDTVSLVNEKIESGQRLLGRLAGKGIPVSAACWVRPADDDRWSLYIVTPMRDKLGAIAAYGQVLNALRELGDDLITSSDIRLLGENDPVARDMVLLHRRNSDGYPSRGGPSTLGGAAIEEIHVYSLKEVVVPIYGMEYPDSPVEGLFLSFEPYDVHHKLTVGVGDDVRVYDANVKLKWDVAAPEGSLLDNSKTTLTWTSRGERKKSNANEVWWFAKLELHGFRILRGPE